LRALLRGVAPALADEADQEKAVRRFFALYEEEMIRTTSVFPGAVDFLESWHGHLAIITNKDEKPTRQILAHLGLDRFSWLQIIGADTLTERKPHPLGLQTVMAKANVQPFETLMIGDGIPDMESANAAGVRSIAIASGYTEPGILSKYQPHAVIHSYLELPRLIAALSSTQPKV
jgi:phosphoglycolate phosphatase